jgi:hypothetical protein
MSSTGFFHSRFGGTMADAGLWAFILGAFVIHPPKPTQLQSGIAVRAALKVGCSGTYEAEFPHSPSRNDSSSLSLFHQQGAEYVVPAKRKMCLHHCQSSPKNRQFDGM